MDAKTLSSLLISPPKHVWWSRGRMKLGWEEQAFSLVKNGGRVGNWRNSGLQRQACFFPFLPLFQPKKSPRPQLDQNFHQHQHQPHQPQQPQQPPSPEKKLQKFVDNVVVAAECVGRVFRDSVCVCACVKDYLNVSRKEYDSMEEEEEAWRECHTVCAKRVKRLCFRNGGVYIKFGQHVASLHYLLPLEYVEEMKEMLDQAPISSPEQVKKIIEDEFNAPLSELFDDFCDSPIASASLAQVHVAHTKEGEKVAVKIQHPHLRQTAPADIAIVDFFAKTLHKFFPDFDYNWLSEEIQLNLPKELDFLNEGKNAERCASLLSRCPVHVTVPHIHWSLSSSRVLTMEFMEGFKVTDRQKIRELGISEKAVASAIAELFNHQIFLDGFVHCDPHPGNVFVRKREGGGQKGGEVELVLLDHGLYLELSSEFRTKYCRLWKGIVSGDVEEIKAVSTEMNAKTLYPLFAAILTASSWESLTKNSFDTQRKANEEDFKMMQENAKKYAKEITSLLAQLPREMLLLLKTNDCLRGIDFALGCPANSDIIRMNYCLQGLSEQKQKEQPGWRTWLSVNWEWTQMQLRIFFFQCMIWWKS